MDVIPVPLVLGLFIELTACFCYCSAAAMSESGEASSASRSPSPPSSRAYSGPPHVPRTDIHLHNTDDSSRRHSSQRSCGQHDYVRLRDNGDDARGFRRTSPMPAPWSVVLDALAGLWGEVEALKADRQRLPPSAGSVRAPVGDSTLGTQGSSPSCSPANFSGFSARVSDDEDMSVLAATADSALIRATKAFGPTDMVSADIDHRVAEMVNFLFDNGLREEDYKAICEDEIVKRPNNCHALVPLLTFFRMQCQNRQGPFCFLVVVALECCSALMFLVNLL
ncbi:hypothetical protein E2C01_042499 [Portunus trituberculatus]|uniref:Uncharacterized protein n=1 Tax=Portunus trituberculatus TaxID=210409 RepID=A0A5B7FTM1_PORTR|nr:hypothetical protein [Portunus trituberculatus]